MHYVILGNSVLLHFTTARLTLLLFQTILGYENSEPSATHLGVQFTQVLSAFQACVIGDVTVIWITDWKRCCVLPDVLRLSQLSLTIEDTRCLCSDVMFVFEIYLKQ